MKQPIRWLGAFRNSGTSLSDSLSWELAQDTTEVCAEVPVHGYYCARIPGVLVGLLARHTDVRRYWVGDAATEADHNGLRRNHRRSENCSFRVKYSWTLNGPDALAESAEEGYDYSEVGLKPNWKACGVVIASPRKAKKFRKELKSVLAWAKLHALPVYLLVGEGRRLVPYER
jgi:hypothetical protein